MNPGAISWGWVDLLTAAVLFVGILRGRKRGLSEELLDTLQWIVIVAVGGLFYLDVASIFPQNSLMSKGFYHVVSYLLIVVGIKAVVSFIKKRIGGKIIGSDIFGRGEYYLGVVAGMVRFGCMYVVALSVLHAPFYTEQMLQEQARVQEKNFGDIRFPTLGGIQHTFFKESATGWATEQYLGDLLIQPVEPGVGNLRSDDSMGRRRERAVDAMMNSK